MLAFVVLVTLSLMGGLCPEPIDVAPVVPLTAVPR